MLNVWCDYILVSSFLSSILFSFVPAFPTSIYYLTMYYNYYGTCIFTEFSVKFMLRNQTYLNNSIVAINDIGDGDDALLCVTDKPDCCLHVSKRSGQGEFYYPNNSRVRFNTGAPWYRNRGPQVVRLNRRNGTLSPTGVYRCEIPDSTGMDQSLYINIAGLHEYI